MSQQPGGNHTKLGRVALSDSCKSATVRNMADQQKNEVDGANDNKSPDLKDAAGLVGTTVATAWEDGAQEPAPAVAMDNDLDDLPVAKVAVAAVGAPNDPNRRPSRRPSRLLELLASALVLQDSDRSTPGDALTFLVQSTVFAMACSVFACCEAWSHGAAYKTIGTTGFFGEDSRSEPAVYRNLPTDSLNSHIEHLAVAPLNPWRLLEFGVATPGFDQNQFPASWIYNLGGYLPIAFVLWAIFLPTPGATLAYVAVALGLLFASTDVLNRYINHGWEYGAYEGGDGLYAVVVFLGLLNMILCSVMAVYGSSRTMTSAVKCKAAGAIALCQIVSGVVVLIYQNIIMEQYFSNDDIVAKLLFRGVGMCVGFTVLTWCY